MVRWSDGCTVINPNKGHPVKYKKYTFLTVPKDQCHNASAAVPIALPRCFSRILTLNWGKSKCGMRPCRRCLLQESANPFVVHDLNLNHFSILRAILSCLRLLATCLIYFSFWILWIRFGWDLQLKSLSQVNKMLPLLIESYNLMKNSSSEDKAAAGDTDVEDPKSHPRLQDWRLCRMLWFDFIR